MWGFGAMELVLIGGTVAFLVLIPVGIIVVVGVLARQSAPEEG